MTVTDEVYDDMARGEALGYLSDWLEEAEQGTAIRIDPGFLRGLITALESEPKPEPLAVVKGWYRKAADDAPSMLYVQAPWTVGAVYDAFEGGGLTPVTITITEQGTEPRMTCPNCHGVGVYDNQTCTYCDGEKVVPEHGT